MTRELQWGILGTSFISGVMANAIKKEGRSSILSVAGRDETRLQAFAAEHEIPKRFQDFDALINDAEVDIIYIALPNHLHHEYCVKAAQAGKAILCEKSLSTDMDKTAVIAKACGEVFFAEGLMYLNHPLVGKLLSLIDSEEFGDLKSIEAHYVASIAEFVNPGSKGALFNLGCYPVSLAYRVVDKVFSGDADHDVWLDCKMSAQGVKGADGNYCESSLQMQLNNGVQLRLHTAETYGLHHSFTLLGTKSVIRMVTNPWLPETTENVIEFNEYEKEVKRFVVSADGDGFYYQVQRVIDGINSGVLGLSQPSATLEDSINIMELVCRWHDQLEA